MANISPLTREQYFAEAVKRYGKDSANWKFRCPSCGNVMTVAEYRAAAKASGQECEGMIAFSCIGRLMPSPAQMCEKDKGFCNYAGGGLFRLNPIQVLGDDPDDKEPSCFFDFADDPLVKESENG